MDRHTVAGGEYLQSEEAPEGWAGSELSPHVPENLCALSLYF